MNLWDIVEELDRQRWESMHKWNTAQIDMFYEVRDRFEMLAMLQDELGEDEE